MPCGAKSPLITRFRPAMRKLLICGTRWSSACRVAQCRVCCCTITVEAGHDIAVDARERVMRRHRVLNVMTHVDPHGRPDLDHANADR